MAVLWIRWPDHEIELQYDDETLARVLVMLDEDIGRRSGIWLNLLDPDAGDRPDLFLSEAGQPHRLVWLPASRIDVEARFDGDVPHQASALAVLGSAEYRSVTPPT